MCLCSFSLSVSIGVYNAYSILTLKVLRPWYRVLVGRAVEGSEKLQHTCVLHWVVVWVWNLLMMITLRFCVCVDTVPSVECNEAVSMHALPLVGCMGLIVLCVTSLPAVFLYCCLLE